MGYNMADEAYINMLVTGMRWRDIIDIFKRNADSETKRIHFGSNYYQCRMNKDGICIGAKDICNPERLDFINTKQYLGAARMTVNHLLAQLNNMKINMLDEKLKHITEELLECYKEINRVEENIYVKSEDEFIKENDIERD